MGPLEIFGFTICLWGLSFLAGFGVMMGAWAGVKAATWAFGPIKTHTRRQVFLNDVPVERED